MVKAKKDEIIKLFRTASVGSFSNNLDKGGPEANWKFKQGKEFGRTRAAMVEVLSPPAMQAKSLVAWLVGGETAPSLHIAAANGYTNLVKVLLDRGATVDATTNEKWTALHYAANRGHIKIVKALLDRGATITATTNTKETALHRAAGGHGYIEVVKVLLDRGAIIDATTHTKLTALDWAARDGHVGVVKVLLDRGATVDATTDEKWTALHYATNRGHIKVVKALLERGTSTRIIDAVGKSGDTALHCAARCIRRDAKIIQLLLNNGANTDRKNNNGETALDIARQRGWERGMTLLTSIAHIDQIADSVRMQ